MPWCSLLWRVSSDRHLASCPQCTHTSSDPSPGALPGYSRSWSKNEFLFFLAVSAAWASSPLAAGAAPSTGATGTAARTWPKGVAWMGMRLGKGLAGRLAAGGPSWSRGATSAVVGIAAGRLVCSADMCLDMAVKKGVRKEHSEHRSGSRVLGPAEAEDGVAGHDGCAPARPGEPPESADGRRGWSASRSVSSAAAVWPATRRSGARGAGAQPNPLARPKRNGEPSRAEPSRVGRKPGGTEPSRAARAGCAVATRRRASRRSGAAWPAVPAALAALKSSTRTRRS